MRVLVVYGSKRHGTEGIARVVAETLREAGLATDLMSGADAGDVRDYDAVVVGGALYAGCWHRHARRFVKRQADDLRHRAVWLFSSGPLDGSAVDGLFGGRLAPEAHGFPASAMAKTHAGDWRDLHQIRNWAQGIAESLPAVASQVGVV